MLKFITLIFVCLFSTAVLNAQVEPADAKTPKAFKKANSRPVET